MFVLNCLPTVPHVFELGSEILRNNSQVREVAILIVGNSEMKNRRLNAIYGDVMLQLFDIVLLIGSVVVYLNHNTIPDQSG